MGKSILEDDAVVRLKPEIDLRTLFLYIMMKVVFNTLLCFIRVSYAPMLIGWIRIVTETDSTLLRHVNFSPLL